MKKLLLGLVTGIFILGITSIGTTAFAYDVETLKVESETKDEHHDDNDKKHDVDIDDHEEKSLSLEAEREALAAKSAALKVRIRELLDSQNNITPVADGASGTITAFISKEPLDDVMKRTASLKDVMVKYAIGEESQYYTRTKSGPWLLLLDEYDIFLFIRMTEVLRTKIENSKLKITVENYNPPWDILQVKMANGDIGFVIPRGWENFLKSSKGVLTVTEPLFNSQKTYQIEITE